MEKTDQMRAVVTALREILGDALLSVYLHGSAVSAGLQPQSDIDLLAVIDGGMTDGQRSNLLGALLRISSRHPAEPGGRRCVEIIVFRRSDLLKVNFSARAEFIYGEWLRKGFEAGKKPVPANNPDHALVLAQARQQAISLFGPDASEYLPEMPLKYVRQAMRDALPALLDGLRGDERNVLLTLARMWYTAATGEFVTKDAAAAWAIPQIADQDAATLDYARRAYRGEIVDEWGNRSGDAKRLAGYLLARTAELL